MNLVLVQDQLDHSFIESANDAEEQSGVEESAAKVDIVNGLPTEAAQQCNAL